MSETVVKIENLVKRYKELIALDHFNRNKTCTDTLNLV